MRFSGRIISSLVSAVLCLCLTGCFPFPEADQDEKNPLIGDGLAKKAAYNYNGAIESFEKALEGNPRLARAHWELALLYSQNVPNPAAAIYHFEKLLKLRPDWPQADTARRFIDAAKIELAKSAPLGPQTPYMQQQLDKLTAQVHEMANENAKLREQNQALALQIHQLTLENTQLKDKLRAASSMTSVGGTATTQNSTASTAKSAIGTTGNAPNQISTPAANAEVLAVRSQQQGGTASQVPLPQVRKKPTTYTVRAGDTLSGIAAAHGVKLSDLIRANPAINPDRIRPGQTISIP